MLNHLLELRRRGIQILICFATLFLLFFFLADHLFQALVKPLLQTLSPNDSIIATQVTTPVFTPLKLAANAAMLLNAPFALLQFWRFISPGLYKNEQNILRITLILSLFLFVGGALFCFYLVLPFMFLFFAHSLPHGVHYMPDMASTLDFITRMLMTFGFCFQVPLICFVLVRLKIFDVTTLKTIRPYVIVSAFILGMFLTPPDVFSQIMLALPLCFLYELGIILSVCLKNS